LQFPRRYLKLSGTGRDQENNLGVLVQKPNFSLMKRGSAPLRRGEMIILPGRHDFGL
jgi:hypothetical protein